ncbi:hypothetical protein bpr_II402 (plasmid) [Butyrivibrio proteoclasticus B316]|uniref:Uncharacterized protein n=1 Tax=Butyrivibrio proteoclasticus (strain ATCC 51982 / DSM 14932 / B316) TaxID=515622 RepID=E0S4K7_BUTPB|nr:hypothetical protein [Butyrivibrio proteoclasticus]ADL36339.1 hypothetical protein bpr_II402 [Butyrivibrio proteoclasticus B316]
MKCCDHLGNPFSSQAAMCKCYGINQSTFVTRIKCGYSLEYALTHPASPSNAASILCMDHLGNEYESFKKMCEAYGHNDNTVRCRLRKGWALDVALTTPLFKDMYIYKGEKYSLKRLAQIYGVPYTRLVQRIRYGFTLEEALTIQNGHDRHSVKVAADGKVLYGSLKQFLKETGISTAYFYRQRKKGIPLEQILSDYRSKEKRCAENRKIKTICETYSISYETIKKRLEHGLSLEEALAAKNPLFKSCKDPFGNHYDTFKAMCSAYGQSDNAVRNRIKDGMTLLEALTVKPFQYIVDDKVYKTIKEASDTYGTCYATTRIRLKEGYSLEEAILIPSHWKWQNLKEKFSFNGEKYYSYKCDACGVQYMFTKPEIRAHTLMHIKNKDI